MLKLYNSLRYMTVTQQMVVILFLSAIITPPDITSQILVSLPLIVLYEISIKISLRVVNNQDNKV